VDRAVSLAQQLLHDYKTQIASLELLPSQGGVFEVTLDGALIFSKRATGRFPEPDEIKPHLERRSSAAA
jgi:selenoprotein W-related protein